MTGAGTDLVVAGPAVRWWKANEKWVVAGLCPGCGRRFVRTFDTKWFEAALRDNTVPKGCSAKCTRKVNVRNRLNALLTVRKQTDPRRIWVAGRCRRPTCRTPFVMASSVIDGSVRPVAPFCSTQCQRAATGRGMASLAGATRRRADAAAAAGKTLARRAPKLTPTLPDRIVVAGWCARSVCGQPFNTVMPLRNDDGSFRQPPRFCSITCWRRDVYAREDRQRAVAAAARLCPACWSRHKARGFGVCRLCLYVVKESCVGKRRRSEEAARASVPRRSRVEGRTMVAYRCPVCGWWHIGGRVDPRQAKRVRFVAETFVRSSPAAVVRELIVQGNPLTMDLKQSLAAHSGLAALRNQLETHEATDTATGTTAGTATDEATGAAGGADAGRGDWRPPVESFEGW